MKTETIGMCVVALLLGMLLANMLKDVCGCNVVEGNKNNKCVLAAWSDLTQEQINKHCPKCPKCHNTAPGVTQTVSHDRARGDSTFSVAAGNSNVS